MAYNFLLWLGKKNLRSAHSVCAVIFVLQRHKNVVQTLIFSNLWVSSCRTFLIPCRIVFYSNVSWTIKYGTSRLCPSSVVFKTSHRFNKQLPPSPHCFLAHLSPIPPSLSLPNLFPFPPPPTFPLSLSPTLSWLNKILLGNKGEREGESERGEGGWVRGREVGK